jgi:LysR family glycine cleavage system transcriptional activator
VRSGNSLTLTKAAIAALPTLEGAFDLLSLATEKMRQHTSSGILSLSVCPSFAQKWLVPRLNRFRESFEGIELRISTTTEVPDLTNSETDIAIGYGPEERFRYAGVLSELLLGDVAFPVCSPDYQDRHRLKDERDFSGIVVLHDDKSFEEFGLNWESWWMVTGMQPLQSADNIRFDSTVLAIDAAIASQGVALARHSLVERDLATGRLVRLTRKELPLSSGYYLSNLDLISEQPKVIAFKEWIFAEASMDRVQPAQARLIGAA